MATRMKERAAVFLILTLVAGSGCESLKSGSVTVRRGQAGYLDPDEYRRIVKTAIERSYPDFPINEVDQAGPSAPTGLFRQRDCVHVAYFHRLGVMPTASGERQLVRVDYVLIDLSANGTIRSIKRSMGTIGPNTVFSDP